MSCGHVWSAQEEAVVVRCYALCGVRVDGCGGCPRCWIENRHKTHPKLVEKAEAELAEEALRRDGVSLMRRYVDCIVCYMPGFTEPDPKCRYCKGTGKCSVQKGENVYE